MHLVYMKLILLISLLALAVHSAPVAMLQHATSSQSIVFHPSQSSAAGGSSGSGQYGGNHQPKYEYKYEVSDHQTGDRKSHWETRDGDSVRGVYTVYEPDGALRTVEYTADALHGFNAVVRRDESTKHQLRPPYNNPAPPNSIHDGYDASTSRYNPERGYQGAGNDYKNQARQPLQVPVPSPYVPGGYNVDHGLSAGKPIDPYKPY